MLACRIHFDNLKPTFSKPWRILLALPSSSFSGRRTFRWTIIERLGLEQANASQHFSILRAKQIVSSRKEGNQVFYSVRDPLLIEVLDVMRRYFQAHIEEAMSMLQQIDLLDKDEQRNRA